MNQSAREDTRKGMFARGFDEGLAIGLPPSEFTLPHPRVHPRLMLLLHRVIHEAFEGLRTKHGSLSAFGEDSITTELYHILENDIRHRRAKKRSDAIPGFDERTFDAVSRHSGATNHLGSKLKKEPDLYFKLKPAFGLRVLPTEYAIFTECKPVDGKHNVGSRYCDDGLNRFVEGEYAWAMQDVLMVGFARHRTIEKHLTKAMREPARRRNIKTLELPTAVIGPDFHRTQPLHVSSHGRGFPWAWKKGIAGPVGVYHSWHDCN